MSMIITLAATTAGAVFGYFLKSATLFKNKSLRLFLNAVKKRQPIVFLETENTTFMRTIIKTFQGLGITDQKELVILPEGSFKPCANLGGVFIAHGDLYRSIAVPTEVAAFIDYLRNDIGMSEREIAEFFKEVIDKSPRELLEEYEKQLNDIKEQIRNSEVAKEIKKELKERNPKMKKEEFEELFETAIERIAMEQIPTTKLNLYKAMPATVKSFLYTGLNRVSIHDMLSNLVAQRELEKIGKKDWIDIAVAVAIILIGIGLGLKFILPAIKSFFAPTMAKGAGVAAGGTAPPRISP